MPWTAPAPPGQTSPRRSEEFQIKALNLKPGPTAERTVARIPAARKLGRPKLGLDMTIPVWEVVPASYMNGT